MNKRKKRIRVLLVDDHPVVRRGIRSCLSNLDHLEIVGEAVDGKEAIAKVNELKPDIVLMDIDMPVMSGLEATRLLRSESPEIRVLILSVHSNKQYVLQIIQSGAQGYVLKDASPADLVRAIESVNGGEVFFSPDISQIVLNQYLVEAGSDDDESASKRLTSREREVLAMIAEGQSNKDMANRLGVGVRTIETHRERVMDKLDIHSVAGLTKYAITNGIARLE
ncbi:MAG: DNA-binding response regulator [Pedosphaera sp.]|jgi:two-component system nitrate/nitrite response regulator NarL|nr:DNA-binding response regulator [Pedosphaera sp.]